MNNFLENSASIADEEFKTDRISCYAETLINSGKKSLLLSSIPAAVDHFASASQLLASAYGETALECGEAYLYYGKALLELSRLESDVLGNALGGVDMDDEDQEGEFFNVEDPDRLSSQEKLEVEDEVAKALEDNFANHERVAKVHATGFIEEEEDMDDEDELDGKETESLDGNAEEMEDEEPSNLQLAWEILELAKVVYSKAAEVSQGDEKTACVGKLCESLLCLGCVSLENENYSQAIADFSECLNTRILNLPSDSRSIAETYFQLGVTHALGGKYEVSELCLENAIRVLKKRIFNLGKMETSDHLASEISYLNSLVAEIEEKIGDHRAMAKASAEGKNDYTTGFSGSSDNKPISSIGIKKVDLTSGKASGSSTVGCA